MPLLIVAVAVDRRWGLPRGRRGAADGGGGAEGSAVRLTDGSTVQVAAENKDLKFQGFGVKFHGHHSSPWY